jgi:alpha-ketoglutaric semialdehyde dehydrogenase
MSTRRTFSSFHPATGTVPPQEFSATELGEVDKMCDDAGRVFREYARTKGALRAGFLREVSVQLEKKCDEILAAASAETGLDAQPRLSGELTRTVRTLRTFADLVDDSHGERAGEQGWQRLTTIAGDPMRQPLPLPSLASKLIPLGPVAVFGASNFPLAYSVAGGDTASALAAGCPVLVKGHSLHPHTGRLVADIVHNAAHACGIPHGVFDYIVSGGEHDHAIGASLVQHPAIAAVGFTGSAAGGAALAKLTARRPVPIPVFAEMGSCNPIFILQSCEDPAAAGRAIAASLLHSHGQMCTTPGVIFVSEGPHAHSFVQALTQVVSESVAKPMLGVKIRENFRARLFACAENSGVETLARSTHISSDSGLTQAAVLLTCPLAVFQRYITLQEECFGPGALVVVCPGEAQMFAAIAALPGCLVGSVWGQGAPLQKFAEELTLRAGRVVCNGVPTGVEVSAAMVHGGPFPATNQSSTTAVGARAIERWCRPVCVQNADFAV